MVGEDHGPERREIPEAGSGEEDGGAGTSAALRPTLIFQGCMGAR